jgi:hypothetical protein
VRKRIRRNKQFVAVMAACLVIFYSIDGAFRWLFAARHALRWMAEPIVQWWHFACWMVDYHTLLAIFVGVLCTGGMYYSSLITGWSTAVVFCTSAVTMLTLLAAYAFAPTEQDQTSMDVSSERA